MNGEQARGLIPPRPNLGPEPWREPDAAPKVALALAIAAMAVLIVAWTRRRARWLRARGSGHGVSGPPTDTSPRGRLVELSETVRGALAARLGDNLRARTTEELSLDERLIPLLGAEESRDLIRFLERIDRVKFAPERPSEEHEELTAEWSTWEPVVSSLVARLRTNPRPRTGDRPIPAERRGRASSSQP